MTDSDATTPFVVMRSHNDMPVIMETLARLHEQDITFELVCLDNESDDGTPEEIRNYTDRIVNIPRGSYIPGRVLNLGMELSGSERVVFLNSDCTPLNSQWLRNLMTGFGGDNRVAAVFGRQIPRPNCHPLFAKDTEDTYGDGSRQKYWRHCFSMASSAISRSMWQSQKFNEDLSYSEDIEWTWRVRQKGFLIRYVADSVAMHSHNYTLKQFYRRHYGEGRAEGAIFPWEAWDGSLIRYSLLPYARQVLGDLNYCLAKGLWGSAMYSPVLRMAQMLGRRRGFRVGLKEQG
jgi:rhamnosyltransferase